MKPDLHLAARPAPDTSTARALASAVAALKPFFDPRSTWSGVHLEHFAYRALREDHPELSRAEAYVLVVAARHVYAPQRGRSSSDRKV